MPDVWFTSDTHFGHERIIELAGRPFRSLEEMDEVLIMRWNDRVRKNDTIFHLGDFALGAKSDHFSYFRRLNGKKVLIRGNHDPSNLTCPWSDVYDIRRISIDKKRIVLCHYAMRVWDGVQYGAYHFYGHSHGNLPGTSLSLDVGVDCWSYYPVNLDEIRKRLARLPPHRPVDHHSKENYDGG